MGLGSRSRLAVAAGRVSSVHKIVDCMTAVGLRHMGALDLDSRRVIAREAAEVGGSTVAVAAHIHPDQATDILR